MREITVPISGVIKPTPGSPVNLGAAFANAALVQKNAQQVIMGAIAVEQQLEAVILDRTFGSEKGAKLSFFVDHILAAEWFSFSAKRRLVVQIVNEQSRLSGSAKNEFDTLLRRVMNYRNAMAHGRVVEKSDGTYLSYFEGSPHEKLLSDDYWAELEGVFRRALEMCREVSNWKG